VLEFAVTSLLTFLVIMDPPGLAPVFVALMGDHPGGDPRRIARKAVVVAGVTLVFFAAAGGPLLDYLGVSLDALRVAGGILLFGIAWNMALGQRKRQTPEEAADAHEREELSVFPLAIPLIAGPGAFASMLVLTTEADGRPAYFGILLGALLAVLLLSYLSLRIAGRLTDALGKTGISVVTRVLGIVLAALAVQLVADGTLGLIA
jgi:multiple antibiotic resistance protein